MAQTTRMLVPLCVTFFLLFGVSSAHAQTAQEIAKKAFGSTVLLVMEDANGQPLSLGSGFFVRDGEIATNLHVVEGAASGYAKVVGQEMKYDIEGIVADDPERDLVVLKILDGRSQVLPLGNSDAVQVGESVFAVGNPQGLEGTFSQGIVSSIRNVGNDKLLQITAPISQGSSGGPVLNGRGEVIGVSVATFEGGQNLNFAIPSNYLHTLLAKTEPVKPLLGHTTIGKTEPVKPLLGHTIKNANLRQGPGTQFDILKTLKAQEILFVISKDEENNYLQVVHINSDTEGWVYGKYIVFDKELPPNEGKNFSAQANAYAQIPTIEILNDSSYTMTLLFAEKKYKLNSSEKMKIQIEPGTYNFRASCPGVIPDYGSQSIESGYDYTWRFYVVTSH